MPIYVYSCANCRAQKEKITLKIVKDSTVPSEIVEPCVGKCKGIITRHLRVITAPSYVGLTPPASSKRATRMSEMRKPRDVNWKARVKKGLNPNGKKLTNLRKEQRDFVTQTVAQSYPDLAEQKKEVRGRVIAGDYKTLKDITGTPR